MKKHLLLLFILPLVLTGCLNNADETEIEPETVYIPPTPEEQQLDSLLNSSYLDESGKQDLSQLDEAKPYNIPKNNDTTVVHNNNQLDPISGEYCLQTDNRIGLSYEQAERLAYRGECFKKGNLMSRHFCNEKEGEWWIQLNINSDIWEEVGLREEACSPFCVIDVDRQITSIGWQCGETATSTGEVTGPYIVDLKEIRNNPSDYDGQKVNTKGYCTYLACDGPDCQRDYQIYHYPLDGTAEENYMFHLKGITSCKAGKKYSLTGVIDFGKMYTKNDDTIKVEEFRLAQ